MKNPKSECPRHLDTSTKSTNDNHHGPVMEDKCEISKDVVDNYRTMSESRISAGATEKLPCWENLSISSWSYDMEGSCQEMCGTIL